MAWGCFSGVGLGPLFPVKGNLKNFSQCYASNFVGTVWGRPFPITAWLCPIAQSKVHKDVFGWVWCVWDELKWRLRARLSRPTSVPDPFLLQHDCAPVHKARSIKTCLDEFGEFGMNWNGDCEPGFLIQTHKCSSKMGRNSHKNTSKSCGKPSQKSGSCYSCKEGTNFIVMSMCLECNVIKVLVGVMVKCPNTFVHLVCLYMERFFLMVLHTLQLCLV